MINHLIVCQGLPESRFVADWAASGWTDKSGLKVFAGLADLASSFVRSGHPAGSFDCSGLAGSADSSGCFDQSGCCGSLQDYDVADAFGHFADAAGFGSDYYLVSAGCIDFAGSYQTGFVESGYSCQTGYSYRFGFAGSSGHSGFADSAGCPDVRHILARYYPYYCYPYYWTDYSSCTYLNN